MSIDLNACVHPMCMGAASRGQKNVIKSTGTVDTNSCVPKCGHWNLNQILYENKCSETQNHHPSLGNL